ncbi:tetratricopeptide repeat protein [Atopomonas sediminilitoris]|uniref:tetratricopeptide repeat protein n=1 Tax=Atopomonas sediminilitoris TaxID=2919919 RepID=UPI001F4DA072|nr:tetratricopeptide repeat protein [Atopomonas sediminilitoris]MCJ8169370.1 tetratricopeptide repeat protein [Atopomonas sediminilitoris]
MDKANLERLLTRGMDNALLRFGLGKALLDEGDAAAAAQHLHACLAFDQDYSAAWKLLGKALLSQGSADDARNAWQQGIAAAQRKGDKQAEKEMQVFLRKLDK